MSTSAPAAKEKIVTGKRWCFTINNPGEERPTFDAGVTLYMCYGLEAAPTTGTIHLQGK